MRSHPGLAYDEDGNLVAIEDFDEAEVDRNLFDAAETLETPSAADVDLVYKIMHRLMSWIFQDGLTNPNGIAIRSIIVCWVFLPQLKPLSLTQISRGVGKLKQSVGRWVDRFKKEFPYLKTCHMKCKSK